MYDSYYSQAEDVYIIFEGNNVNDEVCRTKSLSNCNIIVAALNYNEPED